MERGRRKPAPVRKEGVLLRRLRGPLGAKAGVQRARAASAPYARTLPRFWPIRGGLKADSVKNGWSARYEEARAAGGEVFRKLVRDYHNQCPSGGRGKARASYKLARLESIEAFSKKHQTGSAGKLVDWFDFQAYFKKKLLPTEDRQISK